MPPPTPAGVVCLNGTLDGGYLPLSAGNGQGTRFDLIGIGYLAGLGETTVSGDLVSTGSARSSSTGVLTLQDAQGTVTLSVVAAAQASSALADAVPLLGHVGDGSFQPVALQWKPDRPPDALAPYALAQPCAAGGVGSSTRGRK